LLLLVSFEVQGEIYSAGDDSDGQLGLGGTTGGSQERPKEGPREKI